jgi:hypothetical protein
VSSTKAAEVIETGKLSEDGSDLILVLTDMKRSKELRGNSDPRAR